MVECWWIPSTFTLDQYSIAFWIDTWLTSRLRVRQESTNFAHTPSSVDWYIWAGWQLTKYYPPSIKQISIRCRLSCWLSVDQVSTEYQSRCLGSVDWDVTGVWWRVDQGYQMRLDHRCLWSTWSSESTTDLL